MGNNACRGVRGATCVNANDQQAITAATKELLQHLVDANEIHIEDIGSVIFTATPDLNAAYPAQAARAMGWVTVPLLCMQEIGVTNGLEHCIRVLILWNCSLSQEQVQHVYLRRARSLRPDLARD